MHNKLWRGRAAGGDSLSGGGEQRGQLGLRAQGALASLSVHLRPRRLDQPPLLASSDRGAGCPEMAA
eukprot:7819831-Pyramimonas_sp.AAC.1